MRQNANIINQEYQQNLLQMKCFGFSSGKELPIHKQTRVNSQSAISEGFNSVKTIESSHDSEEETTQFVVFLQEQKHNHFGLPDLDHMDFPPSGSSVALPGSVNDQGSGQKKIPIKSFSTCRVIRQECQFCMAKLREGQKVVQLPCRHYLHFSCVQKWTILSNPCRKCNI